MSHLNLKYYLKIFNKFNLATNYKKKYLLLINISTNLLIMVEQSFVMWGCIPEITRDCIDMTNAGSTYLGLIIGAIIGAIISWWIYNRQKKIIK